MCVANPVHGIDTSEPQVAKVESLVDLVEGFDIDRFYEFGYERLPPVPCHEARNQEQLMRELQVQRRGEQPHVAE